MELFVQMGNKTRLLAIDLLSQIKTTAILSPRHEDPHKLIEIAGEIQRKGGETLLDPQLYCPRLSNTNLAKYDYHPRGNVTVYEDGVCGQVIHSLITYNSKLNTKQVILPSLVLDTIDDSWDRMQSSVYNTARLLTHKPIIETIALSKDALKDNSQIQRIISYCELRDPFGVYIVFEHPDNEYFIKNSMHLYNLMDLVSGLKRQNKKVIVGYAHQQMLCLALSKCDAIASGGYQNSRMFSLGDFATKTSNTTKQRSTWYYCPQALSEFKKDSLDVASKLGKSKLLQPPTTMLSNYSRMLFGSALPSSTAYSEKDSFRHYMLCLFRQCQEISRSSYIETSNAYSLLLRTAEIVLSDLKNFGLNGQQRDFSSIVYTNLAMLTLHNNSYGTVLSHEWNML